MILLYNHGFSAVCACPCLRPLYNRGVKQFYISVVKQFTFSVLRFCYKTETPESPYRSRTKNCLFRDGFGPVHNRFRDRKHHCKTKSCHSETGKSDECRDPAGGQTGNPVAQRGNPMKTETQLAGKRGNPVAERRIPFRARAWRPARAPHALPAPGVRRALSYQRPWPRACAAWHRRIECKAVFLSVHTVFPFCFYPRRRLDRSRPGDCSSACTRVLSTVPALRAGFLASAAGFGELTTAGFPGEERRILLGSSGSLTGVLGAGFISVSASWSVPLPSAFWPSASAASVASAAALALAASPSARAAAGGATAVLTCRKTEIQFPTRACLCVRVAEQWQNSNPIPQLFQNRNTVAHLFPNRCTTLMLHMLLLEQKIPD